MTGGRLTTRRLAGELRLQGGMGAEDLHPICSAARTAGQSGGLWGWLERENEKMTE